MPQIILQSSFQFGEVSELLHAQVESAIYYKAARRIRNAVVIPQGGVEKRFGTKYIGTIEGASTYTTMSATWFDYEDGSKYYLVFTANEIDIWHEGAIVSVVVTTYSSSEVADLDFAQTSNSLIITHGNHVPAILTRTSAHAGWSLNATPTFTHYPTYDFDQNYDTYTFKVYKTTTTTPITITENIIGFVVDVVSSTAMFDDGFIGGLYFGDSGVVRFTARTNTTTMVGNIITIFDEDSGLFNVTVGHLVKGSESVVTEKAFSATRGYPEKVEFFQNRLWFAKTSSLMAGLWGSNFNGFSSTAFNFDDSEAFDTNSVSTVLTGGNKALIIKSVTAFKTLLITSSDGLFSSPLLTDTPITPSNVDFINKQTSDASNRLPPVIFDNEVIFFDQGGRKIKNVALTNDGYNYQTHNLTVLCPHISDTPYSADVYRHSTTKDGTWLLVTNSGGDRNGDLSIYQYVPEQSITGWTISTTATNDANPSYFRHVDALDEDVYFIVERTIDGNTVFYIEQLDWTLNTDSAFTDTYSPATATITGLDHLEGQSVTVIGDGTPMTDSVTTYTVSSGQIVLDTAVESVEVGLIFEPLVRPMPLNVPTKMGPSIYLPKTINIVYVDYYKSVGITVNDVPIAPYNLSEYELDSIIAPRTDYTALEPMGGWNPRQNIDISQNTPLGFTIIGVGYVVSVGD